MKKSTLTKLAAGIGAIAGMRSMAAPALLGEYTKNHSPGSGAAYFQFIGSTFFTRFAEALAAGEIIADKTDNIPNRISVGAFAGRVILGAFAGGSLFALKHKSILQGAFIAGTSAAISTVVSFYIRKTLKDNTNLTNPILGVMEDAAVLGGGVLLLDSE